LIMKDNNNKYSIIFDTVIIMVLCFVTLLATMIFQGGIIIGGGSKGLSYAIKWPSFLITIGGLAFYLIYILRESDKELRKMVNFLHKKTQNEASFRGEK